jgi:molecular chaperone GrpE
MAKDKHPHAPPGETSPEQETAAEPEVTVVETVPDKDINQELETLKDQHLRLIAEYDNYRKRSQRERESLYSDIKADCVGKLLPVIDNLERAVTVECSDEKYAQGVELTLKQCRELFQSIGVKEIPAQGEVFDPNVHEAVLHLEDPAFGANTVSNVLRTGYMIGDKVIRHAMVQVAN